MNIEEKYPTIQQAVQKGLSGTSIKDLTEEFKIPYNVLRKALGHAGWNRRITKYRENDVLAMRNRQMLEMRKKGISLQEIGLIFGITRERVRQIIDPEGSISDDLYQKRQEVKLQKRQVAALINKAKLLGTMKRRLDLMEEWNNLPEDADLNPLFNKYGYDSFLSFSPLMNKLRNEGWPFVFRWEHTATPTLKKALPLMFKNYKKGKEVLNDT